MTQKKKSNTPLQVPAERPLCTVDLVIFTVQADQLQVLLVRRPAHEHEPYPGRWALPGGFVDVAKDTSLQACALRKLREKTGVTASYLEQLGAWGDAQRDPRGWCVTQVYFALLPWSEAGAPSTDSAQWVELDAALRKRLAFDHTTILEAAVERLRGKVEYTSLPAFLLPEPFTLPQLQRTYEVVLGRPMDKSAFRRRMLDAEFLIEAGMLDGGTGRPAMGYRILDRERAAIFPRTFKSAE